MDFIEGRYILSKHRHDGYFKKKKVLINVQYVLLESIVIVLLPTSLLRLT